jgi:hypothetical protein
MLLSQRIRTYGTNKTSNIAGLAILILPSTSWPTIQTYLSRIIAAVDQLQQGDLCELSFLWRCGLLGTRD